MSSATGSHVCYSNSTGKRDMHLDQNGNAVLDRRTPKPFGVDHRLDYSQAVEASEMHGSELSQIETQGDHICLIFSNILLSFEDEIYFRAVVDLHGVRGVTLDGKTVDAMIARGEGSSVIAFRRHGNAATLLLNWRHYRTRRDEQALYRLEFEEMRLRIERQASFID